MDVSKPDETIILISFHPSKFIEAMGGCERCDPLQTVLNWATASVAIGDIRMRGGRPWRKETKNLAGEVIAKLEVQYLEDR